MRRPAFDGKSFEPVVIVVGVLRRGGNHPTIFWVIDDQVGVGSNGDGPFAWKEAEELGWAGAERIDKAMNVEFAALYTVGVYQVHAIFEPGNSVGYLGQ
jgi:hypothetical protein